MVDLDLTLRTMTAADWTSVAAIYKQGMDTGNATFQQDVPAWNDWNTAHIQSCRLVIECDGEILGWAALTPVSGRCVYAGVAEVSVYVSAAHTGQKLGTRLLGRLIEESEIAGFWTLQAGIFPENMPSIKLHEAFGFRNVGRREKIGKLRGVWRDTLLFERRSTRVGTA